MSALVGKIKSHGYWRVVIRPTSHSDLRIESVTDLFPLVQRLSVHLRGWDFPHINTHTQPAIGDNWAEQETEWEYFLERWRLFQSGQFAYLGAFGLDWVTSTDNWHPRPPKPPRDALLGISDIVCRFAEFFEFASALALSAAGGDQMHIEIGCHGIRNRELWLDDMNRVPLSLPRVAQVPEYVQKDTLRREVLIAETRSLGNRWAKELLRRFNWDASDQVLESIRSRFG